MGGRPLGLPERLIIHNRAGHRKVPGPLSLDNRGIIGDGSEFQSLPWNAPQQKSLPSPSPSPR